MVFGVHCNFFIVLPIRLKICRSIEFSLSQDKMCPSEKSGALKDFTCPSAPNQYLACNLSSPEICSKLTMKTPERRQWRRSGVFILNFEHILHLVLVFLFLTLRR